MKLEVQMSFQGFHSKRIVDMDVFNGVAYTRQCYYTCGHTVFMA